MKKIKKIIKTIYWRVLSFGAIHYYGNPSKKLKIVGVTGTNGKTTTATLLYRIATELGYKAGLISTVEKIINGEVVKPEGNKPEPPTTPDSIGLSKLFSKMVEKKCEYVFMEVTAHAMDQKRTMGVNFVGGIFTNLTHDHLDYFKNIENYFQAKKKFFKMLPRRAFTLTNEDDPYGSQMVRGIQAHPFYYGLEQDFEKVHFHGEIKKLDFNGLDLAFNKIPIKSKLIGKFNAYNLLAVWGACSLLGFDMQKVNKILETIEPPAGRFEYFISESGVLCVVDYAHSPDSLEKILLTIKEVGRGQGKIISVFGCGGDRDPLKRPIMGKIGAAHSDIAIFTADNPRSEDPEKIIEAMRGDLPPEDLKKIKTIPNRHEAILEAVKMAQKGDIILCAGKGHEDYQEIQGVKHPFDDMEELRKAFEVNQK
jgi:UDP-N-acetylmuramoyl-L-alanyl-D-glutamate--2,6-diaminopimelate ligase